MKFVRLYCIRKVFDISFECKFLLARKDFCFMFLYLLSLINLTLHFLKIGNIIYILCYVYRTGYIRLFISIAKVCLFLLHFYYLLLFLYFLRFFGQSEILK